MVLFMDELRVTCRRCGWSWVVESGRRKAFELCESCRVKPALSVRYGADRCIPWRFGFDEFDNPLRDGVLFLPGVRVCGHRDCVNVNHILEYGNETL